MKLEFTGGFSALGTMLGIFASYNFTPWNGPLIKYYYSYFKVEKIANQEN